MKKLSVVMLAVLLTISFFVSCDNNAKVLTDERVTVNFSVGSNGRSLGYEIEDVANLKWHYSASKTNQSDPFKFGETEDTPLESLGTEIELSQGKWDFTLWANRVDGGIEGARVYEGSVTGVLITKENSPRSIVISVSPDVGIITGSIEFNAVEIDLKDCNDTTTVYAKTAVIEGVEGTIILTDGTAVKTDLTPGDYVVTVQYSETIDETTVVYASETIVVTVWSGRTTTISGNVSEETGSAIIDGDVQVPTVASVTKTATSGQTTVFTANVAPANNAESSRMDSTTVAFEADALTADTTYSLSVEVSNEVENGNINVGSSSGNAATLNLTLSDGTGTVSEFNGKTVTITTYIAKGLTGVDVTGPTGATITDVNYTSETGELTFTTNHFSKYVVTATGSYEAYNATSKTAFISLDEAVTSAESGNAVTLLKDVVRDNLNDGNNGALSFTKNIIFDGAGHKMTLDTATRGIWIDADGVEVVIKNLTIDGRTSGKGERALQVNNNIKETKITVENCDFSATYYTINVTNGAEVELIIRNSNITGWGAINLWSATYAVTVDNCTLTGINDKPYDAEGWNGFGTVVLEGDTTNATDMGADGLTVTITNSVIDTQSTTGNIQKAILFNSSSKNNVVEISNTEFRYSATGENSRAILYVDNGMENELIIDNVLINSPVHV